VDTVCCMLICCILFISNEFNHKDMFCKAQNPLHDRTEFYVQFAINWCTSMKISKYGSCLNRTGWKEWRIRKRRRAAHLDMLSRGLQGSKFLVTLLAIRSGLRWHVGRTRWGYPGPAAGCPWLDAELALHCPRQILRVSVDWHVGRWCLSALLMM